MSDNVQLEEEQGVSAISANPYMSRRVLGEPMEPSLIQLVKKLKLARTDAQAYYVMIGIGIVSIMLAVLIIGYFVFGVGRVDHTKVSVPKSIRQELPADVLRNIDAQNRR